MTDDKRGSLFARLAQRSRGYGQYSDDRREQLLETAWRYWVFLCGINCIDREHAALNGLCVPPSDPFWERYYPPFGPTDCDCYVLGARSDAGAHRLGGDPIKKIPREFT